MKTKLFALASASALTGAVAIVAAGGCSSESGGNNQPTADVADAGRGKDAGRRPTLPVDEPGEEVEAPEPTCMAERAIDATKFAYKTAGVTEGACTPEEAKAIADHFTSKTDNGEEVSISDWETVVSDTCASCVFSDGEGETWTPIIAKDDRLDIVNRGGCIEAVSGDEACGRAYQQVNECRLAACLPASEGGSGTCLTQDEFEECLIDTAAILTGPCKGAHDELRRSCGKDLGSYEDACTGTTYTFEGPIRVMCVQKGPGGGGGEGDGDGDGEE